MAVLCRDLTLVVCLLIVLSQIEVSRSKEWTDEEVLKLEKQWAEQDGEEDEQTERMRELEAKRAKKPQLDLKKLKGMTPEDILAATKAGQPLMVFVQVDETVSAKDADKVSEIWHTGIQNGGISVQRYNVGGNRFIFMFDDGSEAFEAKKFLLDQPECFSVDIDNQKFPGRANPEFGNSDRKHTEL